MAASPVFQVLLFTDDETFLRTCKKTLQDMIPPIKIKHCHYGTFPKLKKEPIILIYDESTAAKGIEELVQLKNKFPDIGILVYFRENTDFLISLINQPVTFRCISFPVKSSTLQTELKKLLLSYERKKKKKSRILEEENKELGLAREIQKSLLPNTSPNWKDLDIEFYSEPARNVGGDLFTYYGNRNDRALISKHIIAVGDVSGKGISAALLMATCLSRIDMAMRLQIKLTEKMQYLDSILTPYMKPQKQNCALCLMEFSGINTGQAIVRIVNAACIPPFLIKKDGSLTWIRAKGFALGQGIGTQFGYKEHKLSLEDGDTFVLVSDGVIEANNEASELLGFERFETILKSVSTNKSKKILEYIHKSIRQFSGKAEVHDDLTIAVIRYNKILGRKHDRK